MGLDIGNILNRWDELGIFSYVLPFLIIFAVIYGILTKIKLFENNHSVNAIIAGAAALLALQLNFVSSFFQQVFPRFGMAISALVVIVILVGFFFNQNSEKDFWERYEWIGILLGIAVVIWAISSWQFGADNSGVGSWFDENFWAIVVGIAVIVVIWFVVRVPKEEKNKSKPA